MRPPHFRGWCFASGPSDKVCQDHAFWAGSAMPLPSQGLKGGQWGV